VDDLRKLINNPAFSDVGTPEFSLKWKKGNIGISGESYPKKCRELWDLIWIYLNIYLAHM